jgi:hypothetical protein
VSFCVLKHHFAKADTGVRLQHLNHNIKSTDRVGKTRPGAFLTSFFRKAYTAVSNDTLAPRRLNEEEHPNVHPSKTA